jgi:hypothetical protein
MRYQTEKPQASRAQEAATKRGQVVSIVSNYGFIRDNDNVSYYFNPKKLDKAQKYADLKTGTTVEFIPKAGPRGMIASAIKAVPMHQGITIPTKVLSLRGGQKLREGEQCDEDSLVLVQSAWHRSPNDAMSELLRVVDSGNANLAGNVTLHKQTFSEGNYNFTMHSFSAWCGVYWRNFFTEDEAEAQRSLEDKEERIETSEVFLNHEAKRLQQIREKQEANPLIGFIKIVLIVAGILMALVAIGA